MIIKNFCISFILSAALALSACGGKSKVKLDATDGITLDGTFQEAIEGYEKADQLKAAAGLLMFAYEGTGKTDIDYVREATEEASFLVSPQGGNSVFQTRGSVLNEIATESGGILNGKTAQDLIDKYNISTEQYDEYLKDKKEAKAAEEERKAADIEAARLKALSARRIELEKMQAGLAGDMAANKTKRDTLKKTYDDAVKSLEDLKRQQSEMAQSVTPARTLKRSSQGFAGQVTIIINNTTDQPIMKPVVQIGAAPQGGSGQQILTKAVGLYKFEEKKITIAPRSKSSAMTFPVNMYFSKDNALSQGGQKDFSNTTFKSYLVGYEKPDGSKVSLKFNPAKQSVIDNYKAKVAKCDAADQSIISAKTSIPATLKSLDNADVSDTAPKLGATRC